jgi:hypothetical protein
MESKYIKPPKKSTKLFKINIICCMYIIIWTFIPTVRFFADSGVFRLLFFLVSGIWLLSCFLIDVNWLKGMGLAFIFGCIYFLFVTLYFFIGYGNQNINTLVSPTFLYFCILMGIFYWHLNNPKIDKILIICFIICFVITAITTIYNLRINGNFVRSLTSSSTDPALKRLLELRNVGSFDFVYGNMLLLSFLMIVLRNIKLQKASTIILVICSSLIIIISVKANFMILYILLFVSCLFLLFPFNKKTVIGIIAIMPLLFVLYPYIVQGILEFLNNIKELSPSIMTQNKISNMIQYLQNGGNDLSDVSIRFTYMKNSLRSFVSSPFIGVGGYYGIPFIIGGHSQFIDDLGRYGLFGTIPLLLFMNYYRKSILKNVNDFSLSGACNISFLFYFIMGVLNPIYSYGISLNIFFIIPTMVRFIDRMKIRDYKF